MTDDLVNEARLALWSAYCDMKIDLKESAERIEKLEEQAHYANGVADLAMKHRDYAEQRVEKLEAALRALKALHHDGGIDDLQERDDRTYFMVCDALEGKDE